jgi:hypothetical protein
MGLFSLPFFGVAILQHSDILADIATVRLLHD